MALGILGTKLGMTQLFDETGRAVPVTVVQAGLCTVTQLKTTTTDGYDAVQVGYGVTRERRLSKPERGHLQKVSAPWVKHLREYRLDNPTQYQVGQAITVDLFQPGQRIDVAGTSIGRGFAGFQRRHNFGRGPMGHGSKNHRQPGSIGAGTTPGRVYPGKRMAGQMGNHRVTIKDLSIFRIDPERNLILIRGSVPGKPGALVSVTPAKFVGAQG
ncbi:50S ribosomal protein L3 [Gloeomargarita lithophora]|uniref:50S ribosomal protein L3 n=1 Tax=Gloeomargarita lithophora TaxID=1188228 RepID=UPI003F71EFCC